MKALKLKRITSTRNNKLLEKYRHVYVEYDSWWDSEYDNCRDHMSERGVDISDIYFEGFWTQGSGASFKCRVDDWDKFKAAYYPNDDTYDLMFKLASPDHGHSEINARMVNTWGNASYVGECSKISEVEYEPFCTSQRHDEVIRAVHDVWNEQLMGDKGLVARFEEDFQEKMRAEMRALYRDLEALYEHLTSDEVVQEHITMNVFESASKPLNKFRRERIILGQ